MELTLALNRYDCHVSFFNDTTRAPKGLTVKALEVGESSVYRDGTDRHERMLKHLAFDAAEMSLSSFIMAVTRDPALPVVGVPVFPRRFFSGGQMYVNANSGIDTCLYRKLCPDVLMMKSSEDGRRYDVANALNDAMDRRILVERPMRPQLIIIGSILRQNPAQMRLAEYNYMVDALTPDLFDQPFGEAILPG